MMAALYYAMADASSPQQVATALAAQLPLPQLELLLLFCPPGDWLTDLARALSVAFAQLRVVGCTSAGEFSPTGYSKQQVLAVGFDRQYFRIETALISSLGEFSFADAQRLVNDLQQRDQGRDDWPASFAFTLLDGLSSQEERVLLTLETALGHIPHFGGSAGDNNQLKRTHVLMQGQFRTDAAVVLFVRTSLPFQVFSTQHLRAMQQKLVVTAASSDMRTLYELNAEPAAQAYADLLGLPIDALNSDVFAMHPLAVRMGQDYYVRSIQRVNADGSLTFYCAVGVGAVLTEMQVQALLPDLEARLAAIAQEIGAIDWVLGCDCVLRRRELALRDEFAAAQQLFERYRFVGFNTYGEHLDGVHLNQTFTGVVFGKPAPVALGDATPAAHLVTSRELP